MPRIKRAVEFAIFLGLAACSNGQNIPTVHQTATHSSCVNIVALSGAKVDCSNLTPAQKRALESIPAILKAAIEDRSYFDAIIKKLDEMSQVANVKQEQIAVAAKLYDPKSLNIEVENLSGRVALGVTWELVLFRASDQAIFSFATQSIGYVKPHSKSGHYDMNLENIPKAPTDVDGQVRNGDVFTGSLAVDCPDCKGTSYIVHLVWGNGGWIYRIEGATGSLAFPKDRSKSGVSQFIGWLETAARPGDRIPIVDRVVNHQ
jgi:hypothetical protein